MNYKINQKIRLIELFAGVGTQAMALRDIGADFEHYKTSEWEVNAIASYKAIHCENDNTDYSQGMTKEQLADWLFNKGISSDGKSPMTLAQIQRKGQAWLKTAYNNIIATNNVVSITNTTAADLEIVDTENYCYIVTYSFPCQDLSVAGKMRGMGRDSGTRSGLLWEVERILKECSELPQVLLMENVKNVIGKNNMDNFNDWLKSLEELGYSNHYQVMNAKDYGIPQNRERCFMVSILGDYEYEFPAKQTLEIRLKDILEDHVDEKYYIKSEIADKLIQTIKEEDIEKFDEVQGIDKNYNEPQAIEIANCIQAREDRGISNFKSVGTAVMVKEATKKGYAIAYEGDSINLEQPNSKTRRGRVGAGVAQTLTTSPQQAVIEKIENGEPFIAASRERNPENTSDRTPGAPTEQRLEPKLDGTTNTITTVQKDNYVIEPKERFFKQAYDTFNSNDCEYGDTIDSFNQKVNKTGICPTLTTRPEGFKTAILPITRSLRIRKLTPLECWRLMGFTDEDYHKAEKVNSGSQLYKQAGNAIVKQCLMGIFRQLAAGAEITNDKQSAISNNDKQIEMVGMLDIKGTEQVRRVYGADGIAPTLNTMQGGNRQPKVLYEEKLEIKEEKEEMETSELKTTEKAAGAVGEKDERIKQLEEENMRLKAQLFDYMMKERTA